MASIDPRYRLAAVINARSGGYVITDAAARTGPSSLSTMTSR
jgi:hypothetical protein